jgi:hypothetical protein
MNKPPCLLLAVACAAAAASEEPQMLVTATNPEPDRLPTLGVWQRDTLTLVSAAFPNVPEFACDSWCYESDVDYLGATALDGGRLELRHRLRETPNVLWVTTVTPEPGAVEFAARVRVEAGAAPGWVPCPNLCWQLRRAPRFAGAPDPYPEFVKRCFIFTRQGLTFLHQTQRRPIPVRAANDPYNNPVWVQMYVGEWQDVPEAGPTSWAAYSPDRYTTTVIGTVSRDGRYLAAIANDSAPLMAQAWHDCLHNNPLWLPPDAPWTERVWRLRIYAMENDPDALLARVGQDFPKARHLTKDP